MSAGNTLLLLFLNFVDVSSVVGVCLSIEMSVVFTSHRLFLPAVAFVSLLLAYLSVLAAISAVVCLSFGWGIAPRFVPLRLAVSLDRRTGSVKSLVAVVGCQSNSSWCVLQVDKN